MTPRALGKIRRSYRTEDFASFIQGNRSWSQRKNLKFPANQAMEMELAEWLRGQRAQQHPVTGTDLRDMALEMNARLHGPADFAASRGWLNRFKTRHNVRRGDNSLEIFDEAAGPRDPLAQDLPGDSAVGYPVGDPVGDHARVEEGWSAAFVDNFDEPVVGDPEGYPVGDD